MRLSIQLRNFAIVIVVALCGVWILLATGTLDRVSYAVERGKIRAQREALPTATELLESNGPARRVASVVSRAVVSIHTFQDRKSTPGSTRDTEALLDRLQELLPNFDSSPAPMPEDGTHQPDLDRIDPRRLTPFGMGSGFVIDASQGRILTCYHVIQDADTVAVELSDGRRLEARTLGADPRTDLAVLAVEPDRLHEIQLGSSDESQVGDDVFAVGSPFSLSGTFSRGIISAKGRGNLGIAGIDYTGFIQTDAVINPGNSGGPLVNMRGEVVGLITAIATRSGFSEKIGFAIPSSRIVRLLPALLEGDEIVRGYLGVEIVSVIDRRDLALEVGWEEPYGVAVRGVFPDSPGERASLLTGDIIVEFDGRSMPTTVELMDEIAYARPGREVAVRVWRKDRFVDLGVTVDEQPPGFRSRRGGIPAIPSEPN